MRGEGYFSADYGEARERFLDAARSAGAAIETRSHRLAGPEGEPLATDLAWLGPPRAERVLVTISATHGVEGFCGSAVQSGTLQSGSCRDLPPGTALLMIHAINPYGFAWLRRVTEDNVDLNRNFVDHAAPYPENPGYEALADVLCPPRWDDATIAATQKSLEAYAERHGMHGLQKAISGGQYRHPDGIFFGGHAPVWSHRTLEDIFSRRLRHAKRIAVIDYHTGLGPYGHGERICVHPPGSAAMAAASDWYGGDITSPVLGTSSSVELTGDNVIGMERAAPAAELIAIALEYGTIPTPQVRLALCADNWLHLHGDLDSATGRAIKRQIRDAFYPDAADWKEMVWERALETQAMTLAGLSEG